MTTKCRLKRFLKKWQKPMKSYHQAKRDLPMIATAKKDLPVRISNFSHSFIAGSGGSGSTGTSFKGFREYDF